MMTSIGGRGIGQPGPDKGGVADDDPLSVGAYFYVASSDPLHIGRFHAIC